MKRLFIVWAIALSASGLSQTNSTRLDNRIPYLRLDNLSIPEATAMILRSTGLPGGIIRSGSCVEEAKYSFTFDNMTLEDALNYIMAADRSYSWKLNDGIINVIPSGPIPSLLTVSIDRFSVSETNFLASAVSDRLLSQPAVRARSLELKLKHATQQGGLSNSHEPSIRLELHNVTVLEALNQIALKHGAAVWQYSETHCQERGEFQVDWVVH